nr:Ig-like domain-containing protein [Microbacterium excoecariae]
MPDQSLETLAGSTPFLRDGGGNVVTVSRQSLGSTDTNELFVEISGVTVTSGSVAAEAGVAYLNTAGRVSESVVGPIEAAGPHGWGVVKTNHLQGAGSGTVETELTIARSTVAGGVLFDGGRGADGDPANDAPAGIRQLGYVSNTAVEGSVTFTQGVGGFVRDSRVTEGVSLVEAPDVEVSGVVAEGGDAGVVPVADAAPTAAIVDPGAGLVLSPGDEIAPLVRARDDFAVSSVALYADGELVGSSTASPYRFAWAATEADAGTEVALTAVVTDAAGQQTESEALVVSVAGSGSGSDADGGASGASGGSDGTSSGGSDGAASGGASADGASAGGSSAGGSDGSGDSGSDDEAAGPALALSASRVAAGGSVTIDGSGFAAGADLTIELHSTPQVIATVTTDASGAFEVAVTIPAGTPAGDHTIVALSGSDELASAPLEVTEPGDLLATGGSPWVLLAGLGAFALLAGAALVLVRRRTRTV